MPVVKDDAGYSLRCVTAHSETATMQSHGDKVLFDADPKQGVTFRQGTPVRCFVCKVCGYVELYSGLVTEPEKWSKQA